MRRSRCQPLVGFALLLLDVPEVVGERQLMLAGKPFSSAAVLPIGAGATLGRDGVAALRLGVDAGPTLQMRLPSGVDERPLIALPLVGGAADAILPPLLHLYDVQVGDPQSAARTVHVAPDRLPRPDRRQGR